MQEVTRDAIVSVLVIAALFGILYVYLMTRHRERMTILDKNLAQSPFTVKYPNLTALKYGIFLVGISIGLLMGYLLQTHGLDEGVSYTAMVCLFGGISLISSYIIIKKLDD